jgi:hypothetical protein
MKLINFDGTTITSQFLSDGDVIERGGREIELLAVCRNDRIRKIGIAFRNDKGGVISADLDFDLDIPVATVLTIPDGMTDEEIVRLIKG